MVQVKHFNQITESGKGLKGKKNRQLITDLQVCLDKACRCLQLVKKVALKTRKVIVLKLGM